MPFHTVQSEVLSVTEYSARLGRALREVGGAVIEGEVQKVHITPRGMLFFDLTDGESLLSCKVFPRETACLEHTPKQGDLVQAEVDRPDLYADRGSLNLIVSQVRLAGEGELLRRRQELIARLTAEGLCDPARRRALPRFPHAVGVIAGRGSDGMSDVIRALSDRWPAVHIITCASVVQGKTAPHQLIDALVRLRDHPLVDVIIVARGGGSVQDLVCFDDEGLCRAMFACAVPVVCAIGHTDNNPVCNHVSWPAFTPSRSAELVVPSAADVRRDLVTARERLDSVPAWLELAAERVRSTAERLDCATVLDARALQIRERAGEVQSALDEFLSSHQHGLEHARGILAAVPHRAARELGAAREQMAAVVAVLASTGQHLTDIAKGVRDAGERVRQGTRRQLDDHARDYSRALARLTREARAGLGRREARAVELVERERDLLGERAHRRLERARSNVAHQGALIAAQDFRPRGWMLAAAEDGAPVRSTADLTPGKRIDLHLHDGHAGAVVENINHKTGSSAG